MRNPKRDHEAATASRFDERLFHAVRHLEGARRGLLVAVSGGADSVALAVSLARISGRLGLTLELATLDHGVRPEAAKEVEQVVALAASLRLTVHPGRLALAHAPGFEERARAARYAELERLRAERGLALIATAHTASDQAETVLMRLGRGSALAGAGAILARTPTLIRPLLGFTRAEVEAYLTALGLPWVEDPMNRDPRFLRVRVRRELLPIFEAVAGPRVAQHLAHFARYAAEDDAWLQAEAQRHLPPEAGPLEAAAVACLARPLARRVIVSWLTGHQVPVDAPLIEDVLAAIAAGRGATLPGDRLLVHRGGALGVEAAPPRKPTAATGVPPADGL